MIGLPSLLLELALPLFATGMLLVLGIQCARKERTLKGAVGVLAALVFALLVDVRLYHQVRNHRFLASLAPGQVREIRLERKALKDPARVAEIVRSLNRAEWFSANHGGWSEMRWLSLELQSGERRSFRVAAYQRERGAVIAFLRHSPAGYFHDGYAFSRDLPETLSAAGLRLEGDAPTARDGLRTGE